MTNDELRAKIRFYLIDSKTTIGKVIDIIILLLNLTLCLLFVIDTYTPDRSHIITNIDSFIVSILIVEFFVRLYASKDRIKFLFSPYTIIDVVSILPTLIGWFAPVDTLRFLTLLRVLRIFRVLRFLRFLETDEFFFGSVADYTLRLFRLFTSIGILFFITAGLVYSFENQANSDITNFGDALYFTVVTLTTVGFGDITPITGIGRFITAIAIVAGIIIIPWQASKVIKVALQMNSKVAVVCKHCGLKYHDKDASHCKHCGNIIYQEVDGS